MKRFIAALSVTAMVLLVTCAAYAGGQQIFFDNGNSDPNVWGQPSDAVNWNSPTATVGGAMWLKTGSGGPVQYPFSAGDLNLELWVNAPNGVGGFAWARMVTLLTGVPSDQWADASNNWVGTAGGDMTAFGPGYDGFFFDNSGIGYQVPNTSNITGPYSSYQLQLYAWMGNYNSFSAAAAAGQPVAFSGAFTQPVPFGAPPPIPGDVNYMPAMILRAYLTGDANLDGVVNIDDLSKVLTNYDKSSLTWLDGDFTGDGTVNISDLSKVLSNYDRTGARVGTVTPVPEPSGAALLATCAAAGFLMRRCKRASQNRNR